MVDSLIIDLLNLRAEKKRLVVIHKYDEAVPVRTKEHRVLKEIYSHFSNENFTYRLAMDELTYYIFIKYNVSIGIDSDKEIIRILKLTELGI